jgi:hypothetical protein
MTAHDYFTVVVGEIGIDIDTFYHRLKWWEIRSIIRGYNRRQRSLWSATRWGTYYIMSAWNGKGMSEHGIRSPKDLLEFPWEKTTELLSIEEQKELQKEMANAKW